MTFLQAIFLGILQGLTEFLPISSSGHLVIFQKIFNFSTPPIAFDALVHFGTLVALLIFFLKDIKKIFQNIAKEIRGKRRGEGISLILFLVLGTIPIVFVGFFLKEKIGVIFNSLLLVGFSFLTGALILILTILPRNPKRSIKEFNFSDAIIIGLFQAFSILPGISRSGSTISAALFRGIKKESSFKFSFFLGMIAIFGANLLQIPEIFNFTFEDALSGILGFSFAAIVGFFALKWLQKIVIKRKLHYFGIYCAILGIICILFS